MLGLAAGLGAGLGGCHRSTSSQSDAVSAVQMGTYRAVLTLPGGELPFGLELAADGTKTAGYLLNGKERVPLNEVTLSGGHLEFACRAMKPLTADAHGDQLQGEVVLSKPGGKQQHIALHAQRGQEFRFFEKPAANNADLSGRWAVKFTDDEGKLELAVGEFAQVDDVITGTFLAETGDHRYLAGQVKGDELYLSTFDGAHAFLYKAKLGPEGALAGDFWVGTAFHENWTGKRDPNALPARRPMRSPRCEAAPSSSTSPFPILPAKTVQLQGTPSSRAR